MIRSDNLPNINCVHVSKIEVGFVLANLGELLEIEERDEYYALVISRMKEKQVFKFEKDAILITLNNITEGDVGDTNV